MCKPARSDLRCARRHLQPHPQPERHHAGGEHPADTLSYWLAQPSPPPCVGLSSLGVGVDITHRASMPPDVMGAARAGRVPPRRDAPELRTVPDLVHDDVHQRVHRLQLALHAGQDHQAVRLPDRLRIVHRPRLQAAHLVRCMFGPACAAAWLVPVPPLHARRDGLRLLSIKTLC